MSSNSMQAANDGEDNDDLRLMSLVRNSTALKAVLFFHLYVAGQYHLPGRGKPAVPAAAAAASCA
jgi:hypothetical protein